MFRPLRSVSLAAAMLVASSPLASAQITVGTPSTANCYPFICLAGDGYFRYQQVYTSTAFSSNVFINSLTFYKYISSSYPNTAFDGNTYALSLSTTSKAVNGLSTNPTANLGADNTPFWTGILSGPIGSSFTLTGTPFRYMPSLGNLLLDVMISGPFRHPNTGAYGYLEADGSGTTTSRAWGNSSVNPDFVGLVTTFGVSDATIGPVVPEPASMTLMGTGLVVLALIGRRKLGRSDRFSPV